MSMYASNRFFPFLLALILGAPLHLAAAEKPAKPSEKAPSRETDNPYVKRFQELDRNKDGYVTLDEWPLTPESFRTVDRDQDGRLAPAELLTPNVFPGDRRVEPLPPLDIPREDRVSRILRERDQTRAGTLPTDVWNPLASARDRQRFQNLDRNFDHRLSRTEWRSGGARFDRLDRNHDGLISPDEWPRP
jgi:Ca2+-binding EF-hand superfamily protein